MRRCLLHRSSAAANSAAGHRYDDEPEHGFTEVGACDVWDSRDRRSGAGRRMETGRIAFAAGRHAAEYRSVYPSRYRSRSIAKASRDAGTSSSDRRSLHRGPCRDTGTLRPDDRCAAKAESPVVSRPGERRFPVRSQRSDAGSARAWGEYSRRDHECTPGTGLSQSAASPAAPFRGGSRPNSSAAEMFDGLEAGDQEYAIDSLRRLPTTACSHQAVLSAV